MNRWQEFQGEKEPFEIVNLGRPAVFLIPAKKLTGETGNKIRQDLHLFLTSRFGSYTTSKNPSFGVYTDVSKRVIPDECIEYEVSFAGKDRLPILLKKLAELALALEEECIYLKADQYACLVYPKY